MSCCCCFVIYADILTHTHTCAHAWALIHKWLCCLCSASAKVASALHNPYVRMYSYFDFSFSFTKLHRCKYKWILKLLAKRKGLSGTLAQRVFGGKAAWLVLLAGCGQSQCLHLTYSICKLFDFFTSESSLCEHLLMSICVYISMCMCISSQITVCVYIKIESVPPLAADILCSPKILLLQTQV